jgi:hypothetical protein
MLLGGEARIVSDRVYFVRDVDVSKRGSHDSERWCICVLGISMLLGGEAMIVNDGVYVC